MLINREKVITFDWPECRRFYKDVSLLIILSIVEYKTWQAPNYPYPRALLPIIVKMFKERLDRDVLEYSRGPYRNAWFLVKKKKPREYRLINSATLLNTVTRRDTNLPPLVDK